MGTVKVTNIEPIADNGTVTLGGSGDIITLGSGATVTGTGLVGITEADQWRLTANTNSGTDATVSSNWERNDSNGFNYIGTGLTESSGVFTFPSTGIYLIIFTGSFTIAGGERQARLMLQTNITGSSYVDVGDVIGHNRGGAECEESASSTFIFDVTNTTTHSFRFQTRSFSSGTLLSGTTTYNETCFSVFRIGDT